MSHQLPEKGLWHVAGRRGADEMPFDLIKLDLRGRAAGTVRARNLETQLRRVRVTGPDRFVAGYDVRGHRGEVAGVYRPDGALRLSLTGTVTASFVACAADTQAADGETEHGDTAWGWTDWGVAETPAALRALAGAVDALCRPAETAQGAAA
jgi:hypothetical protein